jgi:hypothetical protein
MPLSRSFHFAQGAITQNYLLTRLFHSPKNSAMRCRTDSKGKTMTQKFIIDALPTPPKGPSPQAYRESAVMWQLRALHAQTEAVVAIAAEHGINIADIDPHSIAGRAEDLVAQASHICRQTTTSKPDEIANAIKNLRSNADALRADTSLFVKVADFRAAFRFSGMLPALAEQISTGVQLIKGASDNSGQPAENTDQDSVGGTATKLAVASARRCYKAESEQHSTFSLQINAICDLCMEMVLAAASEVAPK